jgi:arylsulfatase A-like enzyme
VYRPSVRSRSRRIAAVAGRSAALTVALALAAGAGCRTAPPQARGASVLLVTIDTLRADHLGAWGYERATSPGLDRLAREGIRFANAAGPSSWTLPSHASMLTGLEPAEHGVQHPQAALPPSAPTLATRLQAAGYETFAAVSHVYLGHRWGFDRGFDTFDESAAEESPHTPVAEKVVDSALAWLKDRGPEEDPFFAWLHIFDPHWDYSPPEPFASRFDPDYDGPFDGSYETLRPFIRALAPAGSTPPPLAPRDLEHLEALYEGEIAYVDHHLARLFEHLRASGLLADMLVVVASDHGEEFMEHGSLEGHQWTLYEEVVHVPFILRLPGRAWAGTVVERHVSTVGLADTVLELLGLPGGNRSLVDVVQGKGDPEAATLLSLTANPVDPRTGRRTPARIQGLRGPGWKFLRHSDGRREFYDAIAEKGEQENRADADATAVARLEARLERRLSLLERLPDAGTRRMSVDEALRERLRKLGYAE